MARLTDLQVRNAKAGEARREIADPEAKGLYLVVQPSGAKSWALRYRYGGKPTKLTLGPVKVLRDGDREPKGAPLPKIGEPMTLGNARRLAADLQQALVNGDDPSAPLRVSKAPKADPDRDLCEVAALRFLERHARPKTRASTFAWTSAALGFRLADPVEQGQPPVVVMRDVTGDGDGAAIVWKGRAVQTITKRDVNELLDAVEAAHGGHAANKTLAAVRRMFNWFVEQDVIGKSPCDGVKRRLEPARRDRVLTDGELRLVWKAAGELGWPFGHMTKLLILTGCRLAEIGGATWGEYSHNRQVLELPALRTKNKLPHNVPLAPAALAVFADLAKLRGEAGDYILSTTGGGRPVSGFSKAKKALDAKMLEVAKMEAKAAGADPEAVKPIPLWRYHDLRRTAVTNMARLGVALPVIERAVNHISGSFGGIVGVYQRHTYAAEVADAFTRLGEAVERLAKGEELAPSNILVLVKGDVAA